MDPGRDDGYHPATLKSTTKVTSRTERIHERTFSRAEVLRALSLLVAEEESLREGPSEGEKVVMSVTKYPNRGGTGDHYVTDPDSFKVVWTIVETR